MRLFVILSLFFSTAMAQSTTEVEDRETLLSLTSSILHLTTTNLTCKEKADCELVPAGQLLCRGPSIYLITSASNPHIRSIAVMNEKLIEIDGKYSGESNGICVPIEKPDFGCYQNLCLISS